MNVATLKRAIREEVLKKQQEIKWTEQDLKRDAKQAGLNYGAIKKAAAAEFAEQVERIKKDAEDMLDAIDIPKDAEDMLDAIDIPKPLKAVGWWP